MSAKVKSSIYVQSMILPVWLLVGIAAMWSFKLQHSSEGWMVPFVDTLLFVGIHFLFLLIISNTQRYHHSRRVFSFANMSSVILFATLCSLSYYALTMLFFPSDKNYLAFINSSMLVRSIISFLLFALITAIFWIDQQKVREQRLQKFAVEKEREARHIELNSIQQQFKPHFLFNSLNSINALTISNPREAQKMVHLLSEFMRAAVRENQSELVDLKQEIRHIKLYTEIEQVRFGNRLVVEYKTDPETLNMKLPSLILQPLIENAVKYGLYGHTDIVTISIESSVKKGQLCISVSSPFSKDQENFQKGTGFGLQSIEKKMLILYKQANLLFIIKTNKLYTATLNIPQL